MSSPRVNVDPEEVDKFDRIAHRWWDPAGEFKPLHAMNPVRFAFIASQARLAGCRALDVGCGGGLLTESLARSGAMATGIDAGAEALVSARLHAQESGLPIE